MKVKLNRRSFMKTVVGGVAAAATGLPDKLLAKDEARPRMVAWDTESTGLDLHHGAKPFMVTCYDEVNGCRFWEWAVNPLTRQPEVPEEDLDRIEDLLSPRSIDEDEEQLLVLQNPTFDVGGLNTLRSSIGVNWPWEFTRDTLRAGHLLSSNTPHDLTAMAMMYLGQDIKPYEKAMEEAVKRCRNIVRRDFPEWAIADKNRPDMPSAKETTWKYDMWLPRALLNQLRQDGAEIEDDHPWWTVTSSYANADSEVTLAIWQVQWAEIRRRGLEAIYFQMMKLPQVIWGMQQRGVTYSDSRLTQLECQFQRDVTEFSTQCRLIAEKHGYELELPKGASPNNSLREFCFNVLHLPPVRDKKAKTAAPTMNKAAMEHWELTLQPGDALDFIKTLKAKRKRDTALSFLHSYRQFGLPLVRGDVDEVSGFSVKMLMDDPVMDFRVLHPSINLTATDTLRSGCSNPNAQQISTQEMGEKKGLSNRWPFGPAPGREWWSLDYENIELRIPFYKAEEADLIALFEHSDDPPYHGSFHLLIFDLLHPGLFKKHGAKCKDHPETKQVYKRVKNGDFAICYEAGDRTADAAYGVQGARQKIVQRFAKLTKLKASVMAEAERTGCVETWPDKTVDPHRGYPLLVSRGDGGRILPTTPFNYKVQSTACWCPLKAMPRCQQQLDQWRRQEGFDGHMILYVHDELVFDFPICPKAGLPSDELESNWWRAQRMKLLMEQSGQDIDVPLRVAVTWNPVTWSKGEEPDKTVPEDVCTKTWQRRKSIAAVTTPTAKPSPFRIKLGNGKAGGNSVRKEIVRP